MVVSDVRNEGEGIRRLRLPIALTILLLPCVAQANASMPYALQVFDYRYWFVYVVAMIGVEAFIIGRSVKTGWFKSIAICVIANLFSALLCPEIFAPLLHASGVAPNPLLYSVIVFTIFGAISALFEAFVWSLFLRKAALIGPVVGPSLKAHAIGVPIALAILLIPEHPYVGAEGVTVAMRNMALQQRVKLAVDQIRESDGKIPKINSVSDFLETYPRSELNEFNAWEVAYLPDFSRFDMGEAKRRPLEWNPELSNVNANQLLKNRKSVWMIRGKWRDGEVFGFVLKDDGVDDTHISYNYSSDANALGYTDAHQNSALNK